MSPALSRGASIADAVPCPKPGCGRSFTCDACLHLHLMRNYKMRWVDVYGSGRDAWVAFCDQHASCTPSMLGL